MTAKQGADAPGMLFFHPILPGARLTTRARHFLRTMATFNKITIVGYLGRDPELRYTPAGDAVCAFSVATTEKKSGGEDITTWFRITTWRRQAEVANQYLSKGKQVYIEGRLRANEYTDRDGNKRTSLEVTATDMQFLGGTRDEDQSSRPRPTPQTEAATPKAERQAGQPTLPGGESQAAERNAYVNEELDENDIPF